jgi:hypothetical protein
MTHPPLADQTRAKPICPNGIISEGSGLSKQCDRAAVNVSVIEYWNLRFVCYLLLEIWDFIALLKYLMLVIQRVYPQPIAMLCILHPEIVVNYGPGHLR